MDIGLLPVHFAHSGTTYPTESLEVTGDWSSQRLTQ